MESRPSRKTFQTRLDAFVNGLREEIVSGKRAAGEFLPSERAFSEQYKLSNLSVRKGLDILVAEGLIVKIPRVGNKVADPAEGGTVCIKFGYHTSIPREAAIDQLLDLFRKKHPNIRVQAVPLVNESESAIRQYMDNGMLDVVTINYNMFRAFLEQAMDGDYLEPLKPNPGIYPFLTDAFTVKGRLLVQPFIFSPVILCYNVDHFIEKQMPEPDSGWSWQQLFDTAARLAIPNERLGFYYHFLSANRWSVFLLQRGGSFERTSDGRVKLRGTRMMEAFRFCREVQEHFPILSENIANGDSEKLFLAGKVSVIMTSYFHLNFLKGSPLRFDIAPLPHFGEPKTLLLSIGLSVNRKSENKEAAMKLVEFLTSGSAQLLIRQQTYSLPALKSAAERGGEETMYRPSRFALFREIVPTFRYFTDLHIGEKEMRTIENEVRLYWAGLEQEESFCTRMEKLLSPEEIGASVPPGLPAG